MGHHRTRLGGTLPSLLRSATLGVPELVRAPVGPAQRGAVWGRTVPNMGLGKGGGTHGALPQEQRVLSLAGSHGRQSCRCTRTASDIITILIMKGQLLQSSPSPRRRERRMQRRSVSLIPSSRGESAAVPGWSFPAPSPGPGGTTARWVFSLLGVWLLWGSLHRSRAAPGVPSSCSQHCPVQAALSPSFSRKGHFGCRGRSLSPKG